MVFRNLIFSFSTLAHGSPYNPRPMPLDEDFFKRAAKAQPDAVEAVLATMYPAVHRVAHSLAGRPDLAVNIVRRVMIQAIEQLPRLRNADAAENWFHHFTVLASRQAAAQAIPPDKDVLLKEPTPSPAYTALVRALRKLPMQQREAFILHYAERLNTRFLAVAMDCSTKAAEQHLLSARQAIAPLAGADFDTFIQDLAHVHTSLTPPESVLRLNVHAIVTRSLWPRRIKRILKLIALLILAAAGAYLVWRFRDRLPIK